MARATTKTKAAAAPDQAPATVPAIKGFDANLSCRGFQFAEGETYTHDGPVVACQSGFHAITGHPLAVFEYYPPAGSRFCRVELSGELHSDDQEKTAAAILTVGKEIGLAGLAQEAVDWVMARATLEGPVAVKPNGLATASGTRGAATASGDQGAATASGYQGAATASGTRGAATASGLAGKVMGAIGNALFAVERGGWDGSGYPILSVACGIVGKDGIEPDAWYAAKDSKLVRVEQ